MGYTFCYLELKAHRVHRAHNLFLDLVLQTERIVCLCFETGKQISFFAGAKERDVHLACTFQLARGRFLQLIPRPLPSFFFPQLQQPNPRSERPLAPYFIRLLSGSLPHLHGQTDARATSPVLKGRFRREKERRLFLMVKKSSCDCSGSWRGGLEVK